MHHSIPTPSTLLLKRVAVVIPACIGCGVPLAVAASSIGPAPNVKHELHHPATADNRSEQSACASQLLSINPYHPNFKRIDKIYRQSLQFGGTAHRIFPHWHTTYPNLQAAKKKLFSEDIPYMVKELSEIKKPNSRQYVAVGVLGLFGVQALPCIDAALQNYEAKGRFTLQQLKIQITVEAGLTATDESP